MGYDEQYYMGEWDDYEEPPEEIDKRYDRDLEVVEKKTKKSEKLPYSDWTREVNDCVEFLTDYLYSTDSIELDIDWQELYEEDLTPNTAAVRALLDNGVEYNER